MTALERKHRRQAQKRMVDTKNRMKPRRATPVLRLPRLPTGAWQPQQRRDIIPSSTDDSKSFSRLQLNAYTVETMQLEVQHLLTRRGDYDGTVTLGEVWHTLRTSRDVADIFSATFDVDKDLWKTHDIIYKRRYALGTMWRKVHEKVQFRFQEAVQHWEQVRTALEPFVVFDEPQEPPPIAPSQPSLLEDHMQKLQFIHDFRQPTVQNAEEAWQRVASHQSTHSKNENDDPKYKVDRMWLDTIRQKKELRLERLQTPALRAAKYRLELAEAEHKASMLLRPFSASEQDQIQQALASGNPGEVICQLDTDIVTRQNMQTLRPGCWLSDEVIHYFLAMLGQRDKDLCTEDPGRKRSHFFKSFFMTKLLNEGHATRSGMYEYRNVRRWSKKVPGKDIFGLDMIFFPINVSQSHWVCAVAFMQEKRIQFYDSMGSDGMEFMQAIFQYIQDEHMDKKKSPLPDVDRWQLVPCTRDTPQQLNLVDCGVFTCMFADFLSKKCPLVFGQEHINQCRDRIALSILQGKAIL